ncbi:glycerol kinase [Paraglaciecola sp. L3A3]|uniref:glycerol kinase n=1 Tax=Paraglaciecola sp. L3A3 TaxID=2686358 RepID=UPI001E53490C|nr:glycerol kinase [Paraglaciecola sp. L3A3]
MNYIVRESDKWQLTAKGRLAGGRIKSSVKLGDYIEWPSDFDLSKLPCQQTPDTPIAMVSCTKLGKEIGLTANKLNLLFSELGWINKSVKGWITTEQGIRQGAQQKEDAKTGIPYVIWPENIIESKLLISSIQAVTDLNTLSSAGLEQGYTTLDGHFVRSKAEVLIDNWLYLAEVVHAYGRKLPIEEQAYTQFYLISGNIYIEYWPDIDELKHQAQKAKRLALYQKYGLKIIQLNDQDIQNIDEVLPRLLLKLGVQAY